MSSTSDPRKGYQLLLPALQQLKSQSKAGDLELVIFGANQGKHQQATGINTHYMGNLHDDISLCLLYNAADVFIAPSLQDNLPNTLVEAMACGTPCIGFDIGGISDLIASPEMGQLCTFVDSSHLAESISTVLARNINRETIANTSISLRDYPIIASAYKLLYDAVV